VRFSVRINASVVAGSSTSYDNQAYVSGISPSSGFAEDLSAPSLDLNVDTDQPTPIAIRSELSIAGRVFVDSSANSATSHDGVDQANESGVSGRLVSAYNNSTNALIDSTVTDGNGDWTMQLDGALSGTLLRIEVQGSTAQPFVSETISMLVLYQDRLFYWTRHRRHLPILRCAMHIVTLRQPQVLSVWL